jgi:hypothetical protein
MGAGARRFWSCGIRGRGLPGGGMRLSHDRVPPAPQPELGRRAHLWRRRRAGRVLAWDRPDAVGAARRETARQPEPPDRGKHNLRHGK